MSRKQKSRKSKKPRTQAISDNSINDDHSPVEVAITENDQLISPLTEVVNDPLSELEDIINNKEITATPSPTPSNRKMIFPIKPLYFLYFMVGVVLFFQLTTVDFVRSTGIHANGNSATNNKSQTSKSSDPGALDNLINNSALTVPDSDIYSVIVASDGSTFIQQRSRDLVNIPQQRPNPIQLLSFQIKNKLNCFVKKISHFFRNLFSFLSPSSSSLSSPTEKNRLEKLQSQSQDNRSTSITTRSSSAELVPDYHDIVWAGKPITPEEIEGIKQLRHLIEQNQSKLRSKWSHSIHHIELLRFLRAKHHHVQHAWKGIQHHDEYRISEFGPESSFMWNSYDHSPLLMEGFWLDYNEVGCPTLVIRTQLHDGYYYNDDPKIYAAYLVRLLEEGRRRFNVGIDHQLCVLMDRAGTVYKNGKKKVDKLDMGVIPGLVQLFRHVYSTLTENYPDVLDSCRIAPASKFFSACYRITSRVMAPQYREKFQILEADELSKKLHSWVNKKYLPEHLGGVNQPPYQSVVNIDFDPHKSKFPINSKRRRKQVAEDQDLFHHEEITEESKK